MTADGFRYAEAVAGARLFRRRHWYAVARAEGRIVFNDGLLPFVALYVDGKPRRPSAAEKATGIPAGWLRPLSPAAPGAPEAGRG